MQVTNFTGGLGLPSLFLLLGLGADGLAQTAARPPLPAPAASPAARADDGTASTSERPPTPSLQQVLRAVLLETVSESYTDDGHWRRDAQRLDGFRIKGGKISLRTKRVRHGFCHRYSAALLRPEETFTLGVQALPEPVEGRTAVDVTMKLKARIDADFAQWTYGVKGFNGSIVSDATIDARIRLLAAPQIRFRWDRTVPSFGIDVHVHEVDLRLRELTLHRVGIIDGWLARQIGEGSRKSIEFLLRRQSETIAQKLQGRLDELRVSRDEGRATGAR